MFKYVGFGMLFLSGFCYADSIVIDGVKYENVVIREGTSQYYVQTPNDGKTINVAKANVKPESVVITKDENRDKLIQEWYDKKTSPKEQPSPQEQPTALIPQDVQEYVSKRNSSSPRNLSNLTEGEKESEAADSDEMIVYDRNGKSHVIQKKCYDVPYVFNPNIPSMIEKDKRAKAEADRVERILREREIKAKEAKARSEASLAASLSMWSARASSSSTPVYETHNDNFELNSNLRSIDKSLRSIDFQNRLQPAK